MMLVSLSKNRPLEWAIVVGVVLLPVLSQIGYSPVSAEYVASAALSLTAGWLLSFSSPRKYVGPSLLVLLIVLGFFLYFGAVVAGSGLRLAIAAFFFVLLCAFALKKFGASLRIAALAAALQIFVTALAMPQSALSITERSPDRSALPSVLHLLMDEQAGPDSIPAEAVSKEEVQKLVDSYVSRGFVVFRKAYTQERHTFLSIARLFNPGLPKPPVVYQSSIPAYLVTKAQLFNFIAKDRVLDVTYGSYDSFEPALRDNGRVAREFIYNSFVTAGHVSRSGMPFLDRAQSAAGSAMVWLTRAAKSPLAIWLFEKTELGRTAAGYLSPSSRAQPLVARSLLRDLAERLDCCASRGTYYFAHLLFPHYPYVFDAGCNVRPSHLWLNRIVHKLGDLDNLETRRIRYRLHFEQAACATREIGGLIDAIDRNPEMRDAAVIVHADHGSRIAIEDRSNLPDAVYNSQTYERDWRGAFLAVRIPGAIQGGEVSAPVSLEQVYQSLVESGFRKLNVKAIRSDKSSPY